MYKNIYTYIFRKDFLLTLNTYLLNCIRTCTKNISMKNVQHKLFPRPTLFIRLTKILFIILQIVIYYSSIINTFIYYFIEVFFCFLINKKLFKLFSNHTTQENTNDNAGKIKSKSKK